MSVWPAFVPVAFGGALGACLRHGVSLLLPMQAAGGRFPWATLCVNLVGCALAGVIYGWLHRLPGTSESWRLFLMVGVLGGFTTFSAFGLDTWHLLRQGLHGHAMTYVLVSVVGGVLVLAATVRFSA